MSREPAEPEPDAVAADDVKPVTEEAAVPATAPVSAEEPSWPDAAAESAFLAEARARGEAPAPVRKAKPSLVPLAAITSTLVSMGACHCQA